MNLKRKKVVFQESRLLCDTNNPNNRHNINKNNISCNNNNIIRVLIFFRGPIDERTNSKIVNFMEY